MLPRHLLVGKTRWFWTAFLLLSPLAYLVGGYLDLRNNPNAQVGFQIDRDSAIAKASEFARSRGVNVSGWDPYIRFKPDNNLLFYYRYKQMRESDAAYRMAPPVAVLVLFRSPDRSENIEVGVDRTGQALGFRRRISRTRTYKEPGNVAAREIARRAVEARVAAAGMSLPVELTDDETGEAGASTHRFKWKWPLTEHPEMTIESRVAVRGETLIEDTVTAAIDDSFAANVLHLNNTPKIISGVLYGLIILIVVIFGTYRFIQRAQQKEVSYSRVALVCVIMTIVMAGFVLIADIAVYDQASIPDSRAPDWALNLSTFVVYALIGLFMGLAYGGGEGDIREAYSGKLVSLDALMTGHLFSRNVARSVLYGWAFGGWMFMLTNAALFSWHKNPTYGEELGPLDAWFGIAPALFPFIVWPMDVILVIVIGILVPLPFLIRRFKKRRIIYPILGIFTLIACTGPFLNFRPWAAVLLMSIFRTGLTLAAFQSFGIVTAIVGLAAPTFVSFAASMYVQPNPTISYSGAFALGTAFLLIALEFYFAFKGKYLTENDVRPVYARNLAERLSMQAEVSAAREAQMRLMPAGLPSVPSLTMAATCKPAYDVGGDFYDVFEIEPGRIGILVAEGGGLGLGSALAIAFAKGYLMPRIRGKGHSDDSPTEIIRGLKEKLSSRIDSSESLSGLGIAYAVIDSHDGQIRYARTGSYPDILIADSGSRVSRPEETSISFNTSTGSEVSVIQGAVSFERGDSILFFTDGISRSWDAGDSSAEKEFSAILKTAGERSSDALQNILNQKIEESAKRTRLTAAGDDLTALIVRHDGIDDGETA